MYRRVETRMLFQFSSSCVHVVQPLHPHCRRCDSHSPWNDDAGQLIASALAQNKRHTLDRGTRTLRDPPRTIHPCRHSSSSSSQHHPLVVKKHKIQNHYYVLGFQMDVSLGSTEKFLHLCNFRHDDAPRCPSTTHHLSTPDKQLCSVVVQIKSSSYASSGIGLLNLYTYTSTGISTSVKNAMQPTRTPPCISGSSTPTPPHSSFIFQPPSIMPTTSRSDLPPMHNFSSTTNRRFASGDYSSTDSVRGNFFFPPPVCLPFHPHSSTTLYNTSTQPPPPQPCLPHFFPTHYVY